MDETVVFNVLALMATIGLAAVLLSFKDRKWRIGLRGLLLITTLASLLLGVVVAIARWRGTP